MPEMSTSIMSDLNFITATKQSLWNVIKEERAKAGPPTLTLPTCDGTCSDAARRHIQHIPSWPWRLRIQGYKHVDIEYCPFCGRKLDA